MAFLKWIPTALAWLPHVIAGIVVIESVLGPGKTGAEKKQAVLAYLSKTAARLGLPWGDAAVQVVSQLIDTVVSIFNLVGLFRDRDELEVGVAEAAVVVSGGASFEGVREVFVEDEALAEFLRRVPK